jgi:hypothetical protein
MSTYKTSTELKTEQDLVDWTIRVHDEIDQLLVPFEVEQIMNEGMGLTFKDGWNAAIVYVQERQRNRRRFVDSLYEPVFEKNGTTRAD